MFKLLYLIFIFSSLVYPSKEKTYFYKNEDLARFENLVNTLSRDYVPAVLLPTLAKDMGYEDNTGTFLEALNKLKTETLDKLLELYDESDSGHYAKLSSEIKDAKKDAKNFWNRLQDYWRNNSSIDLKVKYPKKKKDNPCK